MTTTTEPTLQQLVRAAVAAAGRSPAVAEGMNLSQQAVSRWVTTGRVPAEYIHQLCAMGGNVVTPDRILAALAEAPRRRSRRARAEG